MLYCTTPIKDRRLCRAEEFRGISLVSVVYEAMCLNIQERLVNVIEERQLLAEEQGSSRRGRGC